VGWVKKTDAESNPTPRLSALTAVSLYRALHMAIYRFGKTGIEVSLKIYQQANNRL